MGDTAYSVLELGLHASAQQMTLITTGRLDAVLHEPLAERTRYTINASTRRRYTPASAGTRFTGSGNEVAATHARLVW
jgi:hypothetical protein